MLTFYVDRAVGKLPKARFDVPEKAKDELRRRAGDRDDDAFLVARLRRALAARGDRRLVVHRPRRSVATRQ